MKNNIDLFDQEYKATRVPQLIRQVTDFISYDSKTLHYKRESCCVVVGFFTPSA